MFNFAPLNEESFELAAVKLTYLKLFELLFEDFVTRKDLSDMLKPNNLVVQVAVPAGSGGVTKAIVDPSIKPTPSAQGLKAKKKTQLKLSDVSPEKFL